MRTNVRCAQCGAELVLRKEAYPAYSHHQFCSNGKGPDSCYMRFLATKNPALHARMTRELDCGMHFVRDADPAAWEAKYGDMILGEEFLKPFDGMHEEDSIVPLEYAGRNLVNVWAALGGEGVPTYQCPYTEQNHVWFLPYAVVGSGEAFEDFKARWAELLESKQREHLLKMSLDQSWYRSQHAQELLEDPEVGDVERCLIGPGYTEGTLDFDGNASVVWAWIDLKGGCRLLAKSQLWHNR